MKRTLTSILLTACLLAASIGIAADTIVLHDAATFTAAVTSTIETDGLESGNVALYYHATGSGTGSVASVTCTVSSDGVNWAANTEIVPGTAYVVSTTNSTVATYTSVTNDYTTIAATGAHTNGANTVRWIPAKQVRITFTPTSGCTRNLTAKLVKP